MLNRTELATEIEAEIINQYPRHLTGAYAPVVDQPDRDTLTVYCGVHDSIMLVREVLVDMFGAESCEWNGCTQVIRF